MFGSYSCFSEQTEQRGEKSIEVTNNPKDQSDWAPEILSGDGEKFDLI